MRFINFLNEDVSNNIDIIKKNCKQYLNKSEGLLLYRGFKSNDHFLKIETNRNRKPIDMKEEAADLINRAFIAGFKKPLRSMTTFASSDFNQISVYGKEYYFFPKGKFEVYWSPKIKDLFKNYEVFIHDSDLVIFSLLFLYYSSQDIKWESLYRGYKKFLAYILDIPESFDYKSFYQQRKLIEKLENYKTLNKEFKFFCKEYYVKGKLYNAIRSQHEIMVDCDEYYLLLREDITEEELTEKLFK